MIICIYGDYGVGKDTFADMLVQAYKEYLEGYGTVKKILSYTTRKKRDNEGPTHTFISKKEWEKLTNFVAKTKINNEYYGATIDQFNADYNIYVINEDGLSSIIKTKKNTDLLKNHQICIIKVIRPIEKISIDENRLNREKITGTLSNEFLKENTHIEIDNSLDIEFLKTITEQIPYIIPYFKLIE